MLKLRYTISIVMFTIIFSYGSVYAFSPVKGQKYRAKNDIKFISVALKLFKAENYSYPSTKEGLNSLVNNPNPYKYKNWKQYLKKISIDPWGNKYEYSYPGLHGQIDIYSLGSDGVQSKDDIGNWQLDK